MANYMPEFMMEANEKKLEENEITFEHNGIVDYIKKDCINIVKIPCGHMARSKSEAYIKNLAEKVGTMHDGEYKIIFIADFDQ